MQANAYVVTHHFGPTVGVKSGQAKDDIDGIGPVYSPQILVTSDSVVQILLWAFSEYVSRDGPLRLPT